MGTKFLKMSHIWLSGLALVLGLNSACSSGGSTASSDNATAPVITACGGNNGDSGLLANGNFESGSDNWTGVAANPLSDVNGNVVNYANVETAAANPWDVNLQQVVELTQGLTYKLSFSAMSNVERKIGAGIGLNEEPYTNSQQEVSLTTACQDFEFELSSANFGGANSRVFFEMGAEIGEVIIDDVSLVETTPSAGPDAAPTTSAPTPTATATDVISVYSDAYTDISTVNLNPGWGQSTQFSEESIDSGNVIKLKGLSYQGIEFGGSVDVSSKSTLHVDYWTDDATSFDIFLISDSPVAEIQNSVTISTGSWQSLEIPLTTYSGTVDLTDVFQMKFEGNGTVYLDNIYFSGPGGDQSELDIATNGNFETGDLSGWIVDPVGGTGLAEVDTIERNNGDYSIKLTNTTPSGPPLIIKHANLGSGTVQSGDELTVNFAIKGNLGNTCALNSKLIYEGSGGGNDLKTLVETDDLSAWKNIQFSGTAPSGTSSVTLEFTASCGPTTSGVVVNLDDISVLVKSTGNVGGGSGSGEPSTSAPTPTATDVISVYSDAYTDISTVNLNPGWGQATVFSEETIDGGNVIKLGALNFQGIEMDPDYLVSQDVSGKTTLHLDYWTADSTALNVFLISTGPAEVAYAVPVTTGSWQSLEIPLSTYSGTVNLSDIIQMKFDGNGTIYLDNIYFY